MGDNVPKPQKKSWQIWVLLSPLLETAEWTWRVAVGCQHLWQSLHCFVESVPIRNPTPSYKSQVSNTSPNHQLHARNYVLRNWRSPFCLIIGEVCVPFTEPHMCQSSKPTPGTLSNASILGDTQCSDHAYCGSVSGDVSGIICLPVLLPPNCFCDPQRNFKF